MGGEAGDHIGVLLEDLALVEGHDRWSGLIATNKLAQPIGETSLFTYRAPQSGEERSTWDEGANEVGTPIQEDAGRGFDEALPVRLFLRRVAHGTRVGEDLEHIVRKGR